MDSLVIPGRMLQLPTAEPFQGLTTATSLVTTSTGTKESNTDKTTATVSGKPTITMTTEITPRTDQTLSTASAVTTTESTTSLLTKEPFSAVTENDKPTMSSSSTSSDLTAAAATTAAAPSVKPTTRRRRL